MKSGQKQRSMGCPVDRGRKLRVNFFITFQFSCHPIEFCTLLLLKDKIYLSKIQFHGAAIQEEVGAPPTGTWRDFYREKEKQSKDGADSL